MRSRRWWKPALAGLCVALLLVTLSRLQRLVESPSVQFSYVEGNGSVWLAREGRTPKQIIDADRYGPPERVSWSASGAKLAWIGPRTSTEHDLYKMTVHIVDADGRPVATVNQVTSVEWSPTDQHVAYTTLAPPIPPPTTWVPNPWEMASSHHVDTTDGRMVTLLPGRDTFAEWSPDGSELAYMSRTGHPAIYAVRTGQVREIGQAADRIFGWVQGGRALLVARNFRYMDNGSPAYDAYVLDTITERTVPIPSLSTYGEFWLSPDGGSILTLMEGQDVQPRVVGVRMGIVDLRTYRLTLIKDAVIEYPSESIPPERVAFDGKQVLWATDMDPKTGAAEIIVYRAKADGTGLARLGALGPSVGVRMLGFSPDLKRIAYIPSGPGPKAGVWVADVGQNALENSRLVLPIPSIRTLQWRPMRGTRK